MAQGSPRANPRAAFAGILVLAALLLQSCGMQIAAAPGPGGESTAASEPAPRGDGSSVQVTDIFLWVELPASTPPGQRIIVEVLDDVTGLPYNAERSTMQAVDATHFGLAFRLPLGTTLKYRYLRVAEDDHATPEATPDGAPVRFRMFVVDGPGEVHDIVARWVDTLAEGKPGRLDGRAVDASSGAPIPSLLIFAGGQQTLTRSDGSFQIDGLPAGVHQVTAYSMDGRYKSFKHNAQVAPDASTPAALSLTATRQVQVTFDVHVPQDILSAMPLRMAGNLSQLGNTFSDLGGGVSGLAGAMPVLTAEGRGRYSITLTLPAETDIRYKYTLGDGLWNAEHAGDLSFVLRRLYIPANASSLRVNDNVLTFQAGAGAPVWFDANITAFMPPDDSLMIQFKLSEWLAPVPMWPVAENRWAFQLISPTQIGGDLVYRYCRSGLCGDAFPISTEQDPAERRVALGGAETSVQVDHIKAWLGMAAPQFAATVLDNPVTPRAPDFTAGVMLAPVYHPMWGAQREEILTAIQQLRANTVVISPTWEVSNEGRPRFEPHLGLDPDWDSLRLQIQAAQHLGLRVTLVPTPRLVGAGQNWWAAERDGEWWQLWWEGYRDFILHHADLAQSAGAETLAIGGPFVAPALPGARPDTPADAATRWQALILEVRGRYAGKIAWILPFEDGGMTTPDFLRGVDVLYLQWGASLGTWEGTTLPEMHSRADLLLRERVQPLEEQFGLPVVLLAAYPSAQGGLTNCVPAVDGCVPLAALFPGMPGRADVILNLSEQMEVYNALLAAVNDNPWLDGFITEGYYPPAGLLDSSISIHGKPAEQVLRYWFGKLLGTAP